MDVPIPILIMTIIIVENVGISAIPPEKFVNSENVPLPPLKNAHARIQLTASTTVPCVAKRLMAVVAVIRSVWLNRSQHSLVSPPRPTKLSHDDCPYTQSEKTATCEWL